MSDSTVEIDYFNQQREAKPVPGAVLVHLLGQAKCGVLPLAKGELLLGRGEGPAAVFADPGMSRRHARVSFASGAFTVEDLGSRNGLVVDGEQVPPKGQREGARVLRLGSSIFVLLGDVRPHLAKPLTATAEQVAGATLLSAWEEVEQAAQTSEVLHLHAESGSGKELAARRFHDKGPRGSGPFVAVNCATIPEGVAERVLFGTRKGAFSGAHADASGYLQAAHRGTLFLDEVAELTPEVQAKLLRVLETKEVLPLGATQAQKLDLAIVSATHRDLRREISHGRFREDLFYRLCRPAVRVPPLRERLEEIGFLAELAVARISPKLRPSAALVEGCLLREWPGNVRELLVEVGDAARRSLVRGEEVVPLELLDEEAGRPNQLEPQEESGEAPSGQVRRLPDDERIEAALREAEGRVATAARRLGVHRTQLRRWLAAKTTTDSGPH